MDQRGAALVHQLLKFIEQGRHAVPLRREKFAIYAGDDADLIIRRIPDRMAVIALQRCLHGLDVEFLAVADNLGGTLEQKMCIAIGMHDCRRRERRIDFHRALEIDVGFLERDRLYDVASVRIIVQLPAFDVGNKRADVARAESEHSIARPFIEHDVERARDVLGDVFLDVEQGFGLAVVGLRPEMKTILCPDELRRNAQVVPYPAHRALDDVRDAEPARNLADIDVRVLEFETRCARRDLELGQSRERVKDLFRQAVGKPLLVLSLRQVGKRQDRDRLVLYACRRCVCRRAELVPCDERERDHEANHRDDRQLVAGLRGDRLFRRNVLALFHAVRRQLVSPGKQQRDDEPDRKETQYDLHHPVGRAEVVRQQVEHLRNYPRNDDVGGANTEYVAASEFG